MHNFYFLKFPLFLFFSEFLAQEEEGTWLDCLCKRFDSKLSLYTYLHTCGRSANRNPCVWWCNHAKQVLSHTRRRRRRRRRRINHPRRRITCNNLFFKLRRCQQHGCHKITNLQYPRKLLHLSIIVIQTCAALEGGGELLCEVKICFRCATTHVAKSREFFIYIYIKDDFFTLG